MAKIVEKTTSFLWKIILINFITIQSTTPYFYQADLWHNNITGKNIFLFYDVHLINGSEHIDRMIENAAKKNEIKYKKTEDYITKKELYEIYELGKKTKEKVKNINIYEHITTTLKKAKELNAPIIVEGMGQIYCPEEYKKFAFNSISNAFKNNFKSDRFISHLNYIHAGCELENIPYQNIESRTCEYNRQNWSIMELAQKIFDIVQMLEKQAYDIKKVESKKQFLQIIQDAKKTEFFRLITNIIDTENEVYLYKKFIDSPKLKKLIDRLENLTKNPEAFNKNLIKFEFKLIDISIAYYISMFTLSAPNVFVCAGGMHCRNMHTFLLETGYTKEKVVVNKLLLEKKIFPALPIDNLEKSFFNTLDPKTVYYKAPKVKKIVKKALQKRKREETSEIDKDAPLKKKQKME